MVGENTASRLLSGERAEPRQRIAGLQAAATGSGPEAEPLRGVNRLFQAYVRCHQTLIRASREQDLLDDICRMLVETGGYRLAWVGYPKQDAEDTLRPVAWAGTEPPIAIWRSGTDECDHASSLALPLIAEGCKLGELHIYAAEPDAFDAQARDLLKGLADDLTCGIVSCRMRATQKHMSEVLRETKGKYALARHAGRVGVWDWNLDTNEISLDPILKAMLGYEDHEIQNHLHDWSRCIHPEDMDQVMAAAAVHLGGLAPQYEVEHRMLHRDGSVRWFLACGTAIPNIHGSPCHLLGANMDITERKHLEEQLLVSQKMEAVGRLAGGIAHDFNNWMTIIGLSATLVERQMRGEDPLREHVHRITEATEHAAGLIKQLLSLSRQDFIRPQVLSLNSAIDDLAWILRRIICEDIQLRTMQANDLWLICIDPTHLDQVIMNLVLNARDAMPDGGTLTIETANAVLDQKYAAQHVSAEPGEYVMLAIADTGIGMDPKVQARISEPFFTTKERGRGTGLGLATVFGIVEQNKGHVEFDTEVGQGTTFRIYLPRVEPTTVQVPPPAARTRETHGTETILVAEDVVDVRALMVRTLRAHGYQVLAANDGLEALQVSRKHAGPIHLLLTDLIMPQMNGIELVEKLQPQRPETRVLYMSGYADRPLVKQLLAQQTLAFLPKPFSVKALTEKVRDVLEGRV